MIWVYRLGFLALLVALWILAAQQFGRNVVPTPLATIEAAQRLIAEGRLQTALGASLKVYLSGFGLAVVSGIPVGVLMGGFRMLGKSLEVYVFALAATPRVAFIPLIIVIMGLGADAKIFIIFLGALMPILINTYAGVLAVDEELVEMARSVGARRQRIFISIVLPSAVPFVVAGMRARRHDRAHQHGSRRTLYGGKRARGPARNLWQYISNGRVFRCRNHAGDRRRCGYRSTPARRNAPCPLARSKLNGQVGRAGRLFARED